MQFFNFGARGSIDEGFDCFFETGVALGGFEETGAGEEEFAVEF